MHQSRFFKIYRLLKRTIRDLEVKRSKIVFTLITFYSATLISALLNGISIIFLAALLTSGSSGSTLILPDYLRRGFELIGSDLNLRSILPIITFIFALNLFLVFSIRFYEGWISAWLRLRFQAKICTSYLKGDWRYLRDLSIGEAVGTSTQEATVFTKYITSIFQTIYHGISALVIAVMAMVTSFKICFFIILLLLPVAITFNGIISKQSKVSLRLAQTRNSFAADITDRLNGLLQILVEGKVEYHITKALRTQKKQARYETEISFYQAIIASINQLIPLVCLIILIFWMNWHNIYQVPRLSVFASVGGLGLRLFTIINLLFSSLGNLSRLSGALYPVFTALEFPVAKNCNFINEPIDLISLQNVSYSYGVNRVIRNVNISLRTGVPVKLCGDSGKGKTTFLNLISGLYQPDLGAVLYTGANSGKKYSSLLYRARVGFVTQDVYLFKGSIRENLLSGTAIDEKIIWGVLEKVKAAEFVHELGGLDAVGSEAGKSLSGGQRRRLGIAKILLANCNVLLLDEITAGIDSINRRDIIKTLDEISKDCIIAFISHEQMHLSNQICFEIG